MHLVSYHNLPILAQTYRTQNRVFKGAFGAHKNGFRECRFLGMLLHVELSRAYGVLGLQQVGSIIRMCTRTRLGGLNRALRQGPGDNGGDGAIALKAFFIILVCPTIAIAPSSVLEHHRKHFAFGTRWKRVHIDSGVDDVFAFVLAL